MTRALILALAMLALLPTTVLAYPGERDAMSNPLVRQTVQIALDFWQARGVQPCSAPNVMLADSLAGDDTEPGVEPAGRAVLGGCDVWLYVESVRAAQDVNMGGSETLQLCVTVVHEIGHTAGLDHTADGVMSLTGSGIPWECKVWARRVDRRKVRAFYRLYGRGAQIRRGIG